MNSFPVHLASNSSTDIYANTLSQFANNVQLPPDFNQDRWEVSFESITLDANYCNLPGSLRDIKAHILLLDNRTNEIRKVLILPPVQYTYNILALVLNNQISSSEKNEFRIHISANSNQISFTASSSTCWAIQEHVADWIQIKRQSATLEEESYDHEKLRYRKFSVGTHITAQGLSFKKVHVPTSIKIVFDQMTPVLTSGGYNTVIAEAIFRPTTSNNRTVFYENRRRSFFSLRTMNSTKLSIQLLDEHDQRLNLLLGQPTFVSLLFKEKNIMESKLPFSISSNDSGDMFKNNLPTLFDVQLPHALMLSKHQYQLALTSIIYPSKSNICSKMTKDYFIDVRCENKETSILFLNQVFVSMNDILTYLNNEISRAYKKKILVFKITRKHVVFSTKVPDVELVISKACCRLFGKAGLNHDLKVRIPKATEAMTVGLNNVNLLIPHTIFIYSDIVKASIIGNTTAKLVKIIPHNKSSEPIIMYQPKNLEYVDVQNDTFATIHIELRDATGNFVSFIDPENFGTKINFILKRKE